MAALLFLSAGCSGARQTVTLLHEMQVGPRGWDELSRGPTQTGPQLPHVLAQAVQQPRAPFIS